MAQSKIEWTEMSWNPTTGCSKISPGCKHCYAEVMAKRLQAMGNSKYRNGFEVTLHPDTLTIPYTWKSSPPARRAGRIVFVNSMSDLFHEKIPLNYIRKVFKVMNECPQHVFQVLTKRAKRLHDLQSELDWTPNIWMGVSVETKEYEYRVNLLRKTKAQVRFLSLEPLLGPIPGLNLSEIDWMIVGGESGNGARPIQKNWVVDLKNQCESASVRFFFKQWGGVNKKKNGRLIDGKTYDDMPKYKAGYELSFQFV